MANDPINLVGKLFYQFPTIADTNTYLGFQYGYSELVLPTENFEHIKPIASTEEFFIFHVTLKNVSRNYFFTLTLDYERGIGIYFKIPTLDKKIDIRITDRNIFWETITEIVEILKNSGEPEFASEVTLIALALEKRIWKLKTIECSFVTDETPKIDFKIGDFVVFKKRADEVLKIVDWGESDEIAKTIPADGYTEIAEPHFLKNLYPFEKQPKFKVGDKIIFPKTQNGSELGNPAKKLITTAKDEGLDYLYVIDITYNRYEDKSFNYWLNFEYSFNSSLSFYEEEMELYEENTSKFKVGDKVKIITSPFDREYTIKSYSKPNKEYIYILKNNQSGNESTYLETELELVNDKKGFEDCNADVSKITSTQVKEFYDLNKSKIDKLNPKLSCLIFKALISLSEYEKCGKPSSETLPKPKIDLLLDIENFKI
jgi:co-chaperonin GroES (HSP10)